jgi:NAD(P)H dehydrogenase (quinone)
MKRIFILLGHTDKETFCGMAADRYEMYAQAAGHEVRRQNIGEMQFDPILHHGYKAIQSLEPDLLAFQENIEWAQHIVIVYPTWWSSMPAILKGLFDRAWLPHFAFNFADHGLTWKKLLKGRTARIITCANTRPWVITFMYGAPTVLMEFALLRFSGIKAKSTMFGPTERVSEHKREKWLTQVDKLARRGR